MKKLLVLLLTMSLVLSITACGGKRKEIGIEDVHTQTKVETSDKKDEEGAEAVDESGEEVENTEDNTQLETPENTQNDNTQPTVTKTTMYAKSSVNVRSGAGTSNSKIGSIAKGQEIVKVGEENGWSKIEFNGATGYVNSNYLSTEKVSTITANSSTGNSNSSTAPSSSSPVEMPIETKPSVTECEHWYQPVETEEYTAIKKMVWGCNGCGFPLFTIDSQTHDAVNIPDLYFHRECYSEKLGTMCPKPCGWHSEMYYQGYCYTCHDEIQLRACTYFYKRAEYCVKNAGDLGTYEKLEPGHAYIKSCSCGKNSLVSGGEKGGLVLKKEICKYCGDVKTYPEK